MIIQLPNCWWLFSPCHVQTDFVFNLKLHILQSQDFPIRSTVAGLLDVVCVIIVKSSSCWKEGIKTSRALLPTAYCLCYDAFHFTVMLLFYTNTNKRIFIYSGGTLALSCVWGLLALLWVKMLPYICSVFTVSYTTFFLIKPREYFTKEILCNSAIILLFCCVRFLQQYFCF